MTQAQIMCKIFSLGPRGFEKNQVIGLPMTEETKNGKPLVLLLQDSRW